MDPANYSKLINSRHLTYNYYITPSSPSINAAKPTILFIHGFPALSSDWEAQVVFFEKNGYAVIAPDMLGYGRTDKPLDAEPYQTKLLAKDVVDILDAEKVDRAVVIGHDWYDHILGIG
jgi:soluble epoxide hydrolase / lipid-phosphate phosphatase